VRADYGGEVFIGSGVTFSVCNGATTEARNGGKVYMQSDYGFQGDSIIHMRATNGGIIAFDPVGTAITASASHSVTVSTWVIAGQGGVISVPNMTFSLAPSFTVTGTRISQGSNSTVYTAVGNTACLNSYFPGTVNGASDGTGACL
jgi:hypothetical protein